MTDMAAASDFQPGTWQARVILNNLKTGHTRPLIK
jgi:hypothetical protein